MIIYMISNLFLLVNWEGLFLLVFFLENYLADHKTIVLDC